MPRPSRPTLAINIQARRQRILVAAGAIIAHDGIPALSMRKLARQASVSVTTLYNLFGSRHDILLALAHELVDRIDRMLDANAPLDDPIARCRAVITVSIDHIVEHESMCRPMFLALHRALPDRTADEIGFRKRAAGMQQIAIAAAIERGLLRGVLAPDVLASQIYHGYEMACALWADRTIDAAEFQARALYGLYVALLAVANDALRPALEAELVQLEAVLRKPGGAAGDVTATTDDEERPRNRP